MSITREIIDALGPFDISVHDHLVVGTSGVVSFRTSGLI
ncbi:MAG: JAB domain-containing protein [Rhizobium rhizophilum]